jgi:hypothetical protein
MKRTFFVFLLTFFLAVIQTPAFAAPQIRTVEDLMKALAFADTSESIEFADNFAIEHPEMTKKVLFFLNPIYKFQKRAKQNAFYCLKISSYKGFLKKEIFFDLALKFISKIDSFHQNIDLKAVLPWYRNDLSFYGFRKKNDYSVNYLQKLINNAILLLKAMQVRKLIYDNTLGQDLAHRFTELNNTIDVRSRIDSKSVLDKMQFVLDFFLMTRKQGHSKSMLI